MERETRRLTLDGGVSKDSFIGDLMSHLFSLLNEQQMAPSAPKTLGFCFIFSLMENRCLRGAVHSTNMMIHTGKYTAKIIVHTIKLKVWKYSTIYWLVFQTNREFCGKSTKFGVDEPKGPLFQESMLAMRNIKKWWPYVKIFTNFKLLKLLSLFAPISIIWAVHVEMHPSMSENRHLVGHYFLSF